MSNGCHLQQEYLKQTQKEAPEHADVALVQEALAKVRDAASHINDVIRQRQNKERILQVPIPSEIGCSASRWGTS